MKSKYIKDTFPDWQSVNPGEWSTNAIQIDYAPRRTITIGLYREPEQNDEYAGTYTLMIFENDDVIFCKEVE